jgi:hypothetical protein
MVTVRIEGGLGNNLFQMAMCMGHALKYDMDYCIPKSVHNPHYHTQTPYILSGVKYSNGLLDLPPYKEAGFVYQDIPQVDDVCFEGYWQSHKYFDDYRDEILKAFNFKYEKKKNYCSIHIRMGDYLDKLDCHPPITKGYIFEAMMSIMTKVQDWEAVKFLVFSDSMRIAKEMLSSQQFRSFPIEYSVGKSEVEDLELASSCNFNIGSNSAYSLWIYYLNQAQDKIGVFPINWFGDSLPHDTSTLYPPKSIVI